MMATQSRARRVNAAKRTSRVAALGLLTAAFLGGPMFSQSTASVPGIQVGEKIPPIAAPDQFGHLVFAFIIGAADVIQHATQIGIGSPLSGSHCRGNGDLQDQALALSKPT